MSGGARPQYHLTPAAEADLEEIWRYSARTWSPDQADRYTDGLVAAFEMLLALPGIARERPEFDPPVRIHPVAQHVIVCRIEDGRLIILRILAARQDWQALLGPD